MHRLLLLPLMLVGLLGGGCTSNLVGGYSAGGASDASSCQSLTSGMGLHLQVTQSQYFCLLTGEDQASASATGRFLDQVHNRFFESFCQAGFSPRPTSEKLVAVCFDSYQQMDSYGRQADGTDSSWMDGYYSYHTNRVAFVRSGGGAAHAGVPAKSGSGRAALYSDGSYGYGCEGINIRTTTHELAHQLAFNSGLQRRDVTYPFWLTEGLATNFEADSPTSLGLNQTQSRYLSRLADAKAGGRLIPLDRLLAMTEISGSADQATRDAYAQAWGLFHFLLRNHPAELRRYMADIAGSWGHQSGDSLRRQFISTFGPLEPLEKEFLRFAQ